MRAGLKRALEIALASGLYLHAASLPLSMAGIQIGAGVAFAAALGLRAWRRTALDLPALAFFAAAAVSLFFSSAPPGRFGLERLLPLGGFFVVAWGVGAAAEPARRALRLFAVMLGAAGLAGAVALVQHFTGFDPARVFARVPLLEPIPTAAGRYYGAGMFGSRLMQAHVLALAAAFALGLAAALPLPRRVLAAGAAAAAGALGGVWTAFARAAWLGLAAAAAVTAGGWKAGRALAGAALLAGALVVALHSGTRARLASAFDLAGNSDRVRIWRVGLAVAAEHPWTGVGFGRYPAVAGARPDAPPNLDWAHNQPLTLLAETGVAGLLAAAYLAAAALWALWRRSRSTEGTPERRALAAGGLASAVTLAAVSLFHDPLFEMPVVYAAAFLTALALFPGPTAAPPGPA